MVLLWTFTTIFSIISMVSLILAILAFKYAVDALTRSGALEKSTHTVQFVPMEPNKAEELDKMVDSANAEFKENVAERYGMF